MMRCFLLAGEGSDLIATLVTRGKTIVHGYAPEVL